MSLLSSPPEYERTLRFHSDTVSGIVFSPNNNDNSVLVWDLENQDKKPYRLLGHKSLVNDVAVTSNGLQIASASSDQTVRLWSYDGSSDSFISYSTKNNSAPVKSVDFSCDSKMLVTGSDDKTVKLFNVGDKKLVASMISHTNWVKCVRFSMDARLIASCSDDKTVKFWDVEKKKLNYTISDYHAGVVNSVRFHPDNSLIGSACFDKKLRLFDIRSKTLVQVYEEHKKPVTSLAFHPHGIYLASTCYDELVRIFDIRSGKILYTLSGHQGATTAVNFSHYGDLIATGAQEGLVTLWNSNLNEEAEERDFYYFPLENDPNVIKSSSDERRDNLQISYFESSIKNLSLKDNTNMVVSKKSNIKSGILSQPPQNTQDSVTEELAKVFEKMVYQLELITNTFQNFEQRLNKIDDLLEYVRLNPEHGTEEITCLDYLQTQKAKIQNEINDKLSQIGTVKCSLVSQEKLLNSKNTHLKQSSDSEYFYRIKP